MISVPTSQDLSKKGGQENKTNTLSRFIGNVKRKRKRFNLFRNSSFGSQSTTATEATDASSSYATHSGYIANEDAAKTVTTKTVRLAAEGGSVYYTLPRCDYTPEELCAAWFQPEENTKIAKDCYRQVQKMEKGEILKDKKYCSRGLETHTRLAALSKTQNRRFAMFAVIDEQAEQRQLGVIDDEAISHRYHQTASSSQLWACTVGLRDQRAAEEYLDCC